MRRTASTRPVVVLMLCGAFLIALVVGTIALILSNLRDHAIDSPMGKKLDGFEWVLFVAGHSERHTKQINEVKADPNFPKA